MTTVLQTLDTLNPGDTRVRAGAAINNAITVISVLLENMAHEYSSNGAIPDATQAPLSTRTDAPPVDQQRMAQLHSIDKAIPDATQAPLPTRTDAPQRLGNRW